MRAWITVIISGVLLSGCAASAPPSTSSAGALSVHHYATANAPALAFDVPSSRGVVPINLSRDSREPMAYGGFESLSSEYYDVQVDDDQLFLSYPSSYERRVISDRVGVLYR